MMGVPLMVLYEISVVAVWIFGRKGFGGFDVAGQEDGKGKNEIS